MIQEIVVTKMPEKPVAYPIYIGKNLFDIASWLPKEKFSQLVIITDHRIKKQYGLQLQKCLQDLGYPTLLLSFPPGERSKTYKTKQQIENAMLAQHCDRNILILALGGGVVGDLAGFIAATFLRGVNYIQIPTSLLAMIDSSVGGKTGINTPHGKNLIGSFYQPDSVVADVSLLRTLPKKHRINGLIEAIKISLTHDKNDFHYIDSHLNSIIKNDEVFIKEIVSRAVKIKAGVVQRDEKESAERSLLNFGHTIGHALEAISNYTLLHGYAVAYGILVEAKIANLLGFLSNEHLLKIKELIARLKIHGKDLQQFDLLKLIQATKNDKKSRDGATRYVLLREIGSVHIASDHYVHPVADEIVKQAFKDTVEE